MKKNPTMTGFSFCSIIITLVLIPFTSCKKEIDYNSSTAPLEGSFKNIELAFPGQQGELLKTKFYGEEITVEKKKGYYIWMGDVAFDEKTFDSLRKTESIAPRTFKPTVTNHWPGGEVFFEIQAGFTVFEQTIINDAINNWRNNTSLRFTQRTNQPNFLVITRGAAGTGNFSSFLGMQGGQQIINLQGNAFNTGTAIHEIGHAIGFYHEQSRTDWATAININWANIRPAVVHNFQTYSQLGQAGAQLGAFDFNSIMLYPSLITDPNFVFNPAIPTMTRLDGTVWNQANVLSAGDVETAASEELNMYWLALFLMITMNMRNMMCLSGFMPMRTYRYLPT